MPETKHPAGTKYVPKVKILERLSAVVQECYWLYGAPNADNPNAVERWDVRSLIDYAVLTYSDGHFRPTYPTFYLQRNTVCQLLLEYQEFANWGEWRMWETDKDRTQMQILAVIQKVLDVERSREKAGT
jgi:hypothetical protein